ncbi:hypothetical protein MBLNU459_g3606t1 [Dothideomycetes sp. NU459]
MDVGNIPSEPRLHPDCCVAVSQPLLAALADLLPRSPSRIVSIGSGSGFLEAALLHLVGDSLDICGIEVSPSVNKYLLEQNFVRVHGTWDLYPGSAQADVWIFAYPREPRLLSRYVERYAHLRLQKIIWIGPKVDWQDYQPVFASSSFSCITVLNGCGMAEHDMISVATKC